MKGANFDNITVYREDANGQVTAEPSNTNTLLASEENDFRGWECWAGLQNITIDNEGNVWRAICRQGEKLGSIHEGFDLAAETVTCAKARCNCAADIQLSKALPEHRGRLRVGQNERQTDK